MSETDDIDYGQLATIASRAITRFMEGFVNGILTPDKRQSVTAAAKGDDQSGHD